MWTKGRWLSDDRYITGGPLHTHLHNFSGKFVVYEDLQGGIGGLSKMPTFLVAFEAGNELRNVKGFSLMSAHGNT